MLSTISRLNCEGLQISSNQTSRRMSAPGRKRPLEGRPANHEFGSARDTQSDTLPGREEIGVVPPRRGCRRAHGRPGRFAPRRRGARWACLTDAPPVGFGTLRSGRRNGPLRPDNEAIVDQVWCRRNDGPAEPVLAAWIRFRPSGSLDASEVDNRPVRG